jgi:hypothetical protein
VKVGSLSDELLEEHCGTSKHRYFEESEVVQVLSGGQCRTRTCDLLLVRQAL